MRGVVLLLLLAGCAPTLNAVRPARLDRADFFGTLAREERRHALFLGRQGATILEAERFARKAEAALTETLPEPEPAGDPAQAAARDRLLGLVDSPAWRRCPVFAALAFARYDAWAERSRAWPDSREAAEFRRDFEENLAALTGPCAFSGQAAQGP